MQEEYTVSLIDMNNDMNGHDNNDKRQHWFGLDSNTIMREKSSIELNLNFHLYQLGNLYPFQKIHFKNNSFNRFQKYKPFKFHQKVADTSDSGWLKYRQFVKVPGSIDRQ